MEQGAAYALRMPGTRLFVGLDDRGLGNLGSNWGAKHRIGWWGPRAKEG